MPTIQIYSAWWCPECLKAKNLLEMKGLHYREIDITKDGAARAEMVARSGRDTVPQIIIDGQPVGGWGELVSLKASGQLDRLAGTGS